MNLHRLDLVSLSLFVHVARTQSISQAATDVHLAVAAASRRIADLEAALGVTLLERHSRGVQLTASGHALLLHAQRVLAEVDCLSAQMSDYASGMVGMVRLWATTSAVTQFLPQDISGFTAANPSTRIELHEHNSDVVVQAVREGRADLGIFADRTPCAGLSTQRYRSDEMVLVVPRKHTLAKRKSLAFEQALDFDFVSLDETTSLALRLRTEAQALGRSLRVRIHVRSFDAMCQMVAQNLGLAVLPKLAAQPHVHSMGLKSVPLTDAWSKRDLLLGVRQETALPKPVRSLMQHLLMQN